VFSCSALYGTSATTVTAEGEIGNCVVIEVEMHIVPGLHPTVTPGVALAQNDEVTAR
jgi:hypothetical protein